VDFEHSGMNFTLCDTNPDDSISPQFGALLRDFLNDGGSPGVATEESTGMEIETENAVVRVYAHPADPLEIIIDIHVRSIDFDDVDPTAEQLLYFHQINAVARYGSGWFVVIDDDAVLLTRSAQVQSLPTETLSSWIVDGLSRADTLAAGFNNVRHVQELTDEPEESASEMRPVSYLNLA